MKVGEAVKKNQPLFVIEAMKMEGIVAAQQPGIIRQVLLKENTTIEQADCVLEMA